MTGAVQEVEHLGSLGDGAEQGIVAAGPLALLVVADGGAFGVSAGGLHRAVKVQGDAEQSQALQPVEAQVHQQAAEVIDALFVSLLEHPAQGGYVGQAPQAQDAFDQRVVQVGPTVPQFTKAQQHMHDDLQEQVGRAEDLAVGQMAEAGPQTRFEIQHSEELLKHDQSCMGGEGLALELQFRNDADLTADVASTKLHWADLLVACR